MPCAELGSSEIGSRATKVNSKIPTGSDCLVRDEVRPRTGRDHRHSCPFKCHSGRIFRSNANARFIIQTPRYPVCPVTRCLARGHLAAPQGRRDHRGKQIQPLMVGVVAGTFSSFRSALSAALNSVGATVGEFDFETAVEVLRVIVERHPDIAVA